MFRFAKKNILGYFEAISHPDSNMPCRKKIKVEKLNTLGYIDRYYLNLIIHCLPFLLWNYRSYYRGAMGIMLVYDICSVKTFDNIAKWLRNIDEVGLTNLDFLN